MERPTTFTSVNHQPPHHEHPPIKTIIFDLGGVLIDWNPRYLYRSLIDSEDEMEHFLTKITTPDWNEEQDAGRSLAEATSNGC